MNRYCITDRFKEKLKTARQTGGKYPYPALIAFGGGGHDEDGVAKVPDPAQTGLNDEFLRKAFHRAYSEDDTSTSYIGILHEYELVDYGISEAALFDSAGELAAVINFDLVMKRAGKTSTVKFKITDI